MARARIYRPSKTAMQSGKAKTKKWVLEFEPSAARKVEPLMGWTSSPDTNTQIVLRFDTKEEAIAYATRRGIDYQVMEAQTARSHLKAYADNFKADRIGQWTH
ncbi:MAG: ETC complex I subunit [Parvibaculum sp.]|uniref:ETC complex I subunit n=1 Tax=Parvibaculum sp. TaxID=2024848 RepID=UPI002C8AFC96|nr:ETC complex I subunit [Parvibaculum sp.]HMM13512.1 ETC complex I subunit [Parvibaculum sp.]